MQGKTITYQSSRIFYRVAGKGKPIILIHGFGEDGEIWNEQVDHLKDNFRVIIPDIPGSGRSAIDSWQPTIGIEEHAEFIKAITDEEKIKMCTIIGHSMGGYITLAFAEKYPEMLTAFGLVHSTAFADSEEKKLARLKSIEFIKSNGAYEFLKTSVPGLFMRHDGSQPSDTCIKILIEKSKSFTVEALAQYYQAMIDRPDRTAVLKNAGCPVLFIIGEYDMAVPFQQGLQQSYLPARSHINILRNSAHMGMLEETKKVNEILVEFLNLNL